MFIGPVMVCGRWVHKIHKVFLVDSVRFTKGTLGCLVLICFWGQCSPTMVLWTKCLRVVNSLEDIKLTPPLLQKRRIPEGFSERCCIEVVGLVILSFFWALRKSFGEYSLSFLGFWKAKPLFTFTSNRPRPKNQRKNAPKLTGHLAGLPEGCWFDQGGGGRLGVSSGCVKWGPILLEGPVFFEKKGAQKVTPVGQGVFELPAHAIS